MVQLLVTAALVFMSVFTSMVLERHMTAAPEWVWRLISLLWAGAAVVFILFSDFVFPHIRNPSETPVKSTAIVALAAAALVGSAWWLFAVQPLDAETRRQSAIAKTKRLAEAKNWEGLKRRIAKLESDPTLNDAALYFRGILYLNSSPAPDPERYLSLVPATSSLWLETQWLRLANWSRTGDPQLAIRLAHSIDASGERITIYYRLRLVETTLQHSDIESLYREFVQRFQHLFDFTEMKSIARMTVGVPVEMNSNEIVRIPGTVCLFIARLIHTAHNEGRNEKCHWFSQYDRLMASHRKTLESTGPLGAGELLAIDVRRLAGETELLRDNRPLQ